MFASQSIQFAANLNMQLHANRIGVPLTLSKRSIIFCSTKRHGNGHSFNADQRKYGAWRNHRSLGIPPGSVNRSIPAAETEQWRRRPRWLWAIEPSIHSLSEHQINLSNTDKVKVDDDVLLVSLCPIDPIVTGANLKFFLTGSSWSSKSHFPCVSCFNFHRTASAAVYMAVMNESTVQMKIVEEDQPQTMPISQPLNFLTT